MTSKIIITILSVLVVVSFLKVAVIYKQQHTDFSETYVWVETNKIVPTRLVVKELGIDLPIYESEIFEGEWESTKTGVSYLKTSPQPGETGNSIIYGHNWDNLLGKLRDISRGNEIEIVFSDGQKKIWIVQNKFSVTADQTHILSQSDFPKLTIYTCNSFLDSKRLVVTATPV